MSIYSFTIFIISSWPRNRLLYNPLLASDMWCNSEISSEIIASMRMSVREKLQERMLRRDYVSPVVIYVSGISACFGEVSCLYQPINLTFLQIHFLFRKKEWERGNVRRGKDGNSAIGSRFISSARKPRRNATSDPISRRRTRSDFSIHKCGKLPMPDLSGVLRALVLPLHRVLSVYTSGVSCPVSRVTANIRPGN